MDVNDNYHAKKKKYESKMEMGGWWGNKRKEITRQRNKNKNKNKPEETPPIRRIQA